MVPLRVFLVENLSWYVNYCTRTCPVMQAFAEIVVYQVYKVHKRNCNLQGLSKMSSLLFPWVAVEFHFGGHLSIQMIEGVEREG